MSESSEDSSFCHEIGISEDSLASEGVPGANLHIGVWDMLETGSPEQDQLSNE